MEFNVYEAIKGDQFFVGSYPNSFSVGRWFTVEELIATNYEKIEKEYLEKYNPNHLATLELGVFDIANISGFWSQLESVSELINLLIEIKAKQFYEIDWEVFEWTDEFLDNCGLSKENIGSAVFFGKIKIWNDDYIAFDGNGNFESYSKYEYKKEMISRVKDLDIFK